VGKRFREINGQPKINGDAVSAVIRRYRTSFSTTNQGCIGISPEMAPQAMTIIIN